MHMYNTNDKVLISLQPKSLSMDGYMEDIETILNNKDYHFNQISETDNEKAQEEIDKKIRLKKKEDSDKHVLQIYNKPQRSIRVREICILNIFNLLILSLLQVKKILCQADEIEETIQHIKVQRKK